MALSIHASTPAVATGSPTATTASFTPPSGALILIQFSGNSTSGASPSTPTITDNLGVHLTYTLLDFQSRASAPTVDGQCAQWSAVATGSAMTISVTNNASSTECSMRVRVLTDSGGGTPTIGAHGKNGSASAASIAQSYTAAASGGWGFLAVCDWDLKGNETAGTGCTIDSGDTGNVGSQFNFAYVRRSSADDSVGVANTLNATLPATSTNLGWVYAEVLPAAGGAASPDPVSGPYTGLAPGMISPTGAFRPIPWDFADAGAQTITLTDAGSAADAPAVTATVSAADTGSAADATTVAATVPVADAGSASDAVSVSVGGTTVTLTDTGSGSDAVTVAATAPVADAGSAADALAVSAAVALTDTGSAVDNRTATASVPLTDAGSGADSLAAGVPIAVADAGSGSDVLTLGTITVPLAEAGTAADLGRPTTIAAPLAEAATAADTPTVAVAVPVADSGTAADAVTVTRAILIADTGAASDAVSVVQQTSSQVNISDTGSGADCLCVVIARPNTGTTTRPATGATARPGTGATARPGSGRTARPYTGKTGRCC